MMEAAGFSDCSEQEAVERSVSFVLMVADQTNGGNDTEHQAHEHQAGSSNAKGEEEKVFSETEDVKEIFRILGLLGQM